MKGGNGKESEMERLERVEEGRDGMERGNVNVSS
jgi:hypothetical protein